MKALRSSPFRVFLVMLSFLLMALSGLWIMGGSPTKISVEVHSELPSSILAHRFEMHCRLLPTMKLSHAGRQLALPQWASSRCEPIAISLAAGSSRYVLPFPLADIVFRTPPGPKDMDPAVVSCDAEFQAADPLQLEWYGRDERFIYLREYDADHHVRLIKLEPEQVQFIPDENAESSGCLVRYVVVMEHHGWERIYGKLFTKSCEESAKVRLLWICEQLESQH
ncbi:MAG: hypothetical protein JNL67_22860 [Planctomycetaceae bacterium]|nr:hypothetical protein [Planctomycetaceae bacterium]